MQFFSALKSDGQSIHATRWINSKHIVPNEKRQIQKATYLMNLLIWHSGKNETKGTEIRLIVEDGDGGRKLTKWVMRKLLLDRNIFYLDCGGGYMITYIFQNSEKFYLKNRSYAIIILTLCRVEELPTHPWQKSHASQLHRDKPPASGPSQTSACASLYLVVYLYPLSYPLISQKTWKKPLKNNHDIKFVKNPS